MQKANRAKGRTTRSGRTVRVIGLVVGAMMLLAPSASAGVARVKSGVVTYTAEAGDRDLAYFHPRSARTVVFDAKPEDEDLETNPYSTVTAGTGCKPSTVKTKRGSVIGTLDVISCTVPKGTEKPRVKVSLGDQDDGGGPYRYLAYGAKAATWGMSVDGGAGEDFLSDSRESTLVGSLTLLGGLGDDDLSIVGGRGADRAFGGAGVDLLFTKNGKRDKEIDCGAGADIIDRDKGDSVSGCEASGTSRPDGSS